METYISLLRGINVSGQKMIKMTELVDLYKGLAFSDIMTYVQSGNIVFKSDKTISINDLSAQIANAIFRKYKFQVPVIIRTKKQILKAISMNPFLKDQNTDISKLHVTFLSEAPEKSNVELIINSDFSPDKFIISGTEVFLYCPSGYARTKLSNSFFENKLKVIATTRNWNTINKLADICK